MVGVPVIAPVVALSFRPAGSEPEAIAQLYGPWPPPPVSVCENAAPAIPCSCDGEVSVGGETTSSPVGYETAPLATGVAAGFTVAGGRDAVLRHRARAEDVADQQLLGRAGEEAQAGLGR